MNKTTKVVQCYYTCPFFEVNSDGMNCGHPKFKGDKDPYAGMIITRTNSKGGVPKKCPLLQEQVIVQHVIQLDGGTVAI